MQEPTFLPLRAFSDSRGYSYFDIYGNLGEGQINIGVLQPGVVKGLHYHMFQKDKWFCLQGDIHVVLALPKRYLQSQHYAIPYFDSEPNEDFIIKHYYMGEHNPGVLIIPEFWSHGYTNVSSIPTTLLYMVTKKYDPFRPDEQRIKWDKFGVDIWKPENK